MACTMNLTSERGLFESTFPRARTSGGICEAIRHELRSTTPATLPDRTVCYVDKGNNRDGEFYCAMPIFPSLVEIPKVTPAQCDAATTKMREINRKRWLKLHAYIANRVDRRSLSLNDLKDADDFFDCLAGGDDTVDADELCSALQFCGMAPSRKDIDRVMLEIDQDGSGLLDRDEFITLLFDNEMSQRFFDAARSGNAGKTTMLTVPLWSLAYQRKKKLQSCYQDFGVPEMGPGWSHPAAARATEVEHITMDPQRRASRGRRSTSQSTSVSGAPAPSRSIRSTGRASRGPGADSGDEGETPEGGRPHGSASKLSRQVREAAARRDDRASGLMKPEGRVSRVGSAVLARDARFTQSAGSRRTTSRQNRPTSRNGQIFPTRVRKNTAALNAAAIVQPHLEEVVAETIDEAKLRQRQITQYAPSYAAHKTARYRRVGVDGMRTSNDHEVFDDSYEVGGSGKKRDTRGRVDLGRTKEHPKREKKVKKSYESPYSREIGGRRGGGLMAMKSKAARNPAEKKLPEKPKGLGLG